MSIRTRLLAFAILGITASSPGMRALAHDEKHKNLKVLEDTGKGIEDGMKKISKGLGVKCNACHVKGKFESDEVAAKKEARKFLEATVGEKDTAKRESALKSLLASLKVKEPQSAADVWTAIEGWKRTTP